MRAMPQSLPPGLYEAASRRGPHTPGAGAGAVPRQFTGQGAAQTQSPLARTSFGAPPPAAQTSGSDWLITPQEKARFDQNFVALDNVGQGFITGDQAVSFFSNSGLSEDVLAGIWDLADINSEGQLNRDEFAVAMYLIRQQRARKDGRGDLPPSLPPRLVPPSMRQRTVAPSQPTAPAFDNAAFSTQQPKSAADDLFGLDALSSDFPNPQTAMAKADPFANEQASSPASSSSRGLPPQPPSRNQCTTFKPFVPTSSFGQGLAQQSTGGSFQSDQSQSRGVAKPSAANGDLLGDNDPEISKKFTQETSDVSNMSNQSNILNNQLQEAQSKRTSTERDLAASGNQKRELEMKLAQSRSQYEQELREFKSLEERLNTSRNETKKLGQELALVEGTQQDLQTQHQQVATALEADQRENSALKERIRQLNADIAELRPKVEKIRSDARQQKGMTAINKKQLSTNEVDREKLKSERDYLEKSMNRTPTGTTLARGEPTSAVASASTDSPTSNYSPPAVASPGSASAGQSRNPFFRQATQQSIDKTVSSPITSQESKSSQDTSTFDSMFGPSQPMQSDAPPPSSFSNSSQSGGHSDTPAVSTLPAASSATISAVETPEIAEVPAPPPPESGQMTSSSLPLRGHMLRSDSVGSSVRANPPASRSGFSELATPTQSATSSVNGDQTAVRAVNDSTPTSRGGPSEALRLHPRRSGTVPGAFPGEADSPLRSTPTGGSMASENSRDIHEPKSTETGPFGTRIDQFRAGPGSKTELNTVLPGPSQYHPTAKQENTSSAQGSHPGALPNGATKSKFEFPPIQNIQNEESDSDSEQGFDDDFTAPTATRQLEGASPSPKSRVGQFGATPATGQLEGLPIPKSSTDEVETSSGLPTPTDQKSPPSYDQSVPESGAKRSGSNQFPCEYGDLLPSRDPVATSSETIHSPPQPASASASHMSHAGAYEHTQHQHISTELKDAAHHKAPPTDDFDSVFDNLSEANEADDQGHDAFAFSADRKDEYEFNPTFDSPFASRTGEPQRAPSGGQSRAGNGIADGFAKFEPSSSASSDQFHTSQASTQPEVVSQSHDWDEIFSGLEKTPTIGQNGANKDPFSFDQPSQSAQKDSGLLSQPQRPQNLARAISHGTEHDDPILKTLTSMGYPREQSLKALEKYDYNLDKVRMTPSPAANWI